MIKVGETELERWFELAFESHVNEAKFYACLRNADVYAHVPVSDDSKNVRLIQFRHPEGFDAIPIFTSERRSLRAASSSVRTLRLTCIELLRATRGATLVVNPNDGGPTLYPEEIARLLEGRQLENIEKAEMQGGALHVRLSESPPDALLGALRTCFEEAPYLRDAYILERWSDGEDSNTAMLIYLGVEAAYIERAARYVLTVLQDLTPCYDKAVDIAAYAVEKGRPDFLDEIGAVPLSFGQSARRSQDA
jgi:hypothetical protein